MKTVLAADLGGTKLRVALLAEDLSTHGVCEVPTPADRESFLAVLEGQLAGLQRSERPAGWEAPSAIGVGTAGVITKDQRSVVYAPNLPLDGLDVAERFERTLGLPTRLINDGRASALGEYRFGQAKGQDPLLVLFFGTGIGIGLIVNGKPYEGHGNAAGEVGHVQYQQGGYRCPCGRDGCYEAYCGGGPMVARAAERLGAAPNGASKWRVGDLVALYDTEPIARQILDEARAAAGALVASLCTLLNPAAVVLGGGVLKGWTELRGHIEADVRARCASILTKDLAIVPSELESDAILWGAADVTGAFAK